MPNIDQQAKLNIEIIVSSEYEDETPQALMQRRAELEAEILVDRLAGEYPDAAIDVRAQREGEEIPPAPHIYYTGGSYAPDVERRVDSIREDVFYDVGKLLCVVEQDGRAAAWFDTTAGEALEQIPADWANSQSGDTLKELAPDTPIRCHADSSINALPGYGLVQEACREKDYPLEEFIADAEAVGAKIRTDSA